MAETNTTKMAEGSHSCKLSERTPTEYAARNRDENNEMCRSSFAARRSILRRFAPCVRGHSSTSRSCRSQGSLVLLPHYRPIVSSGRRARFPLTFPVSLAPMKHRPKRRWRNVTDESAGDSRRGGYWMAGTGLFVPFNFAPRCPDKKNGAAVRPRKPGRS